MATTVTSPMLNVDEELVGLIKACDSVELKLTVPAADHRTAITGLGLDPLEAQIRQVFFFDTPELALNAAGLVVRARRILSAAVVLGRRGLRVADGIGCREGIHQPCFQLRMGFAVRLQRFLRIGSVLVMRGRIELFRRFFSH